MKPILVLLLALYGLAMAQQCDPNVCKLPNCLCMGRTSPGGLAVNATPQLVFLTFEDSITVANYNNYTTILNGRKNPNGCNISMTFYVNHKNNDYERTHSLYWMGNEMASKTISDTERTVDEWSNLGTDEWADEIGGMRDILNQFALVQPKSSIKGFRAPYLQTNGNATFDALELLGMTYDNSFSTINGTLPNIWPYTLDYGFQQDCQDAKGKCPSARYQGLWIVPMAVLYYRDRYCAMADACPRPENTSETYNYLRSNFDRVYNENRAPLGIYLHSAWFQGNPYTLSGYLDFLDYIQTRPNVYIVSVSKGLDWIKNPLPVDQINTSTVLGCPALTPPTCAGRNCYYVDQNGDDVVMRSCVACPNNYPEPGNPGGNKASSFKLVREEF